MRKLRIGQISPLNLAIPPKKYGGSEKVIYWLCQELPKRGHQVFLFGTKNSKVNCRLIPIIEKGLWEKRPREASPYYSYQIAFIAKKAKELKLDILHDHLGPLSLPLTTLTDVPLIHTLHIPFKGKDRPWAYKKLNSKLVSISLNQRKAAPRLNYLANIYNGINTSFFSYKAKPKDYFLWVGELSPRKGIFEAIKSAQRAKIKLVLAGRIPPKEQKYDHLFFEKYVKNELNKKNIIYAGEKTPKQLVPLYQNAIAFLFPLQWEEPFGLTMIEAMSCGTPVIAFKRGSVPEVVADKKTGFIVYPYDKRKKPNYPGFIEAIKNIDKISRWQCRKRVEENFSIKRMIDEYEKLFYRLAKK